MAFRSAHTSQGSLPGGDDTSVPAPITEGGAAQAGYQRASSRLTLWAALAFTVVLGFSRFSYGLLLPALRADLRGSYGAFGEVASANLAGYLVGTLAVPLLMARIASAQARIRLNTLCIVGLSVTMVASALSANLTQLALWRLLVGLFSAPATVLTLASTLERVAPAERGRASGIAWMGLGVAMILSGLIVPPVIAIGAASGWRLVWVGMGLSGLVVAWGFQRALHRAPAPGAGVAAPVEREAVWESGPDEADGKAAGQASAHARLRGPAATSTAPEPFLTTLATLLRPRRLLFLTLAYFGFGCGYIIYFTYFIALVTRQGVPPLLSGVVWSVIGLAGIVGGALWGRAIDRWPTGYTLALTLATGALGAIAVQGLADEAIGALLMGTTIIGGPALVTALLRRAVADASYTASLSLMTASVGLGQVVGPLLGGAVVDARGLAAGTATTAVALAFGALCAAAYARVQRSRA